MALEGRTPLVIVELELDACSRSYGVGPCTAAVPDGRNNYIIYSQALSGGAPWQQYSSTVTDNFLAAPDGTTTAARVVFTADAASLSYETLTAPYAGPARFYVWVKRGNRATERLSVSNNTAPRVGGVTATWTWATSTGVNCTAVETAAGGWVRLEIRYNAAIEPGDQMFFNVAFIDFLVDGDTTYRWGAQACFPAYFSDFRYIATAGAAVPVNPSITGTGTSQCFNTFPTCQDRVNYDKITKVYRFANQRVDTLQVVGDAPTFPTVLGVSLAPTELTPRQGLGVRASCTVEFTDHTYSDEGVDPYRLTRIGGANWENKSTFWRRLLARNANYENRVMRVITGFMDESGIPDLSAFVTRSYTIQSVTWPDSSGRVTVTGKDPLRLADGDRAVWPTRSRARTTIATDALGTALQCYDPDARLSTDFAAGQVYVRVGREVMRMTAAAHFDGETAITVERATLPAFYPGPQFNVAAAIEVGADVSSCYLFDSQSVPQVLNTLLGLGCGIDSSFLPVATWEAEMVAGARSGLRLSTLLCEPTQVKTLIEELTQLNLNVWWDDRASLVKMRPVLVNPPQSALWTDRANILQDSLDVALNSRTRVSQSWVYFALQWPLADLDKLESYASIEVFADLEAEAVDFYGVTAIQETRTRWLPISQGADAVQMASNLVLRYRYGKCGVTVMVDPKDRAPWTGDTVGLQSLQVTGPNGEPLTVVLGILRAEEQWTDAGLMIQYSGEGQITGLLAAQVREAAITLDTQVDYGAATVAEREANCFICADSRQFADGKPAYTLAG